jgi:hypothetical protein
MHTVGGLILCAEGSLCVQVCIAALVPVAVGTSRLTISSSGRDLQPSSAAGTARSAPRLHVATVAAAVSQSFSVEQGRGAAAVYAAYGSGRVADFTRLPRTALQPLRPTLLNVTGFNGDWFDLQVRCSATLLRTATCAHVHTGRATQCMWQPAHKSTQAVL